MTGNNLRSLVEIEVTLMKDKQVVIKITEQIDDGTNADKPPLNFFDIRQQIKA